MFQRYVSRRDENVFLNVKKSVKSLYDVCIDSLTQHMSLCQKKCELRQLQDVDIIDSEFNSSPFEQLSKQILAEVAEVYNERYFESKTVFMQMLMLTPHCQTLSMENYKGKHVISLLKFASVRCPELQLLRFWNNYDIPMKDLLPSISKFTKLQVLHIVSSPIELDSLFNTLGANCPDLRALQLSAQVMRGCCGKMVSEDGIQGLCVVGKCKLIHTLVFDDIEVTEEVIAIALENLPVLKIFPHRLTVRVLANLHRKALGKKLFVIPTFSLSSIDLYRHDDYATDEDCVLALAVCPFITKVTVRYYDRRLTDDDFQVLHYFKNLRNLQMYTRGYTKDYTSGLAPLLKTMGNSLMFLKLKGFHKLDVYDIIEYCPNLRSLSLVRNLDYGRTTVLDTHRAKKNIVLKNLEMLHFSDLSHVSRDSMLPESLSLLLSSPSLRYIDMYRCNAVTDEALLKAADLHLFPNLEQIQLLRCDLVSRKGFEAMIQKCQSLREFGFFDYFNVGYFRGWRKTFVKRNWQTDFSVDDFLGIFFDFHGYPIVINQPVDFNEYHKQMVLLTSLR